MVNEMETDKVEDQPNQTVAVIFGSSGGIGSALTSQLQINGQFDHVIPFSRKTNPAIDLLDEQSLETALRHAAHYGDLRLIIDATGFLHDDRQTPEKSIRQLTAENLARSFALNAIGPALIMKQAIPLMPRNGKTIFATLSARVGSISDNHLGGWYAYRAAKAALNQLVKTASIELARRSKEAILVALHPGTVATPLSAPFSAQGLNIHSPSVAAQHMLEVLNNLDEKATGRFYDWRGLEIPW